MSVDAVQAALRGEPLDVPALERVSFDPAYAAAIRAELAPLLVALAARRPESAAEVPEGVVDALFKGLTFPQVLSLTGLDAGALRSPLVRPLFLKQLAEKADASTDADAPFAREALALLADPALETASVASLELLPLRVPAFTAFVPFAAMFAGPAELQARLMALNIALLRRPATASLVPPQFVVWDRLESPVSGDVLLFGLQVDYVGELALLAGRTADADGALLLTAPLEQICAAYASGDAVLVAASVERTLARVARADPALFARLDADYHLVAADRPGLLAQLPPDLLVRSHRPLVESLELSGSTLYAVANIAQDADGVRLLPLTAVRLRGMPAPAQLVVASCATASEEGAKYFAESFVDCLRTAYAVPDAADTSDFRATLRANVSRWHLKIPREAAVSTA